MQNNSSQTNKSEDKKEIKRKVWNIEKKKTDIDYYGNIKKDLENIILYISSDYIRRTHKKRVIELAEYTIADLKNIKVGENIIKAELNILTNFLYSPGNMDYEIIEFYNEMHRVSSINISESEVK